MAHGAVPHIVEAHAEVAAMLYLQREIAVSAPHYNLEFLGREDERLEAHLDGLRIAGEVGWNTALAAFDATSEPGEAFVLSHLAFGGDGQARRDLVLDVIAEMPQHLPAAIGALGWLPPSRLRGKIGWFFDDPRPEVRLLALGACSAHRVNPGEQLVKMFDDVPMVRARAFRLAGELGQRHLLGHLGRMQSDNDEACDFYRVWSGALLGERGASPQTLQQIAERPGPYQLLAFDLVVQMMDPTTARAWLGNLRNTPDGLKLMIRGAGLVGDRMFVPWLIEQMADPEHARAAGAAFSMITGADLAYLDLDGPTPEGAPEGPNDDPADSNVELDPEENLEWPEPTAIEAWWSGQQGSYAEGTRYFMGRSMSAATAQAALRDAFQPERRIAALWLAMSQATDSLFNCALPAPVQVRSLAERTAA